MALDKRYLAKHGNKWIVVVKVPDRLRPVVGKSHLKYPLRTDSLAVANREKFRVVAAMKTRLQEAERQQRRQAGLQPDPLVREALEWREKIELAREDPSFYQAKDPHTGEVIEDGYDLTASLLADRAEEIEQREGPGRAKEFHAVATGKATPILSVVDQWLAEKPMKPRQQTDYRRAVLKFDAWLSTNRLANTVEGVTRKIAGRHIGDAFVSAGVHSRTANKDISCLSSLWKWMERRGYVEDNVWKEQSLPKTKPTKDQAKRAYTDDEIKTLFAAKPSQLLKDFIAIAALSGMRVEEIARLTAKEIVNDCFDITEAKTKAGIRLEPIRKEIESVKSL